MPAVGRELSVIYGDTGDLSPLPITVGGTSDRILDGPLVVREGADAVTLEFSFTTHATTEALFDTETATVEDAFRTPRRRLRVVQGAATLFDWNPGTSVNTGFNARPELRVNGDLASDTGRSRSYTLSIEMDLPADRYSQSGRRTSTTTIDFTPARRQRLTIEGEYRALTTTDSARTQYRASIDAYASTIQTALGGNWELEEESDGPSDDTDKIIRFRRVYLRILDAQSDAVTNHTSIIRDTLTVTPTRTAPGDTPDGNPRRLVESSVRYDCWVNSEVTTDLRSLYTGTIRGHMMTRLRSHLDNRRVAVTTESPTFDVKDNKISVDLTVVSPGASRLVELEVTTETSETSGLVWDWVWTGNALAAHEYLGHKDVICTINELRIELANTTGGEEPRGTFVVGVGVQGQLGGALFGIDLGRLFNRPTGEFAIAGASPTVVAEAKTTRDCPPPTETGASWRFLNARVTTTPKRLGLPDVGNTLDLVEKRTVRVHRLIVPVKIAAPAPRGEITPSKEKGF